jgi:hypothetical protein
MQVNKSRGNWLPKCTKTKAEVGITNQKGVSVEIQQFPPSFTEERQAWLFLSSNFNCTKLSSLSLCLFSPGCYH